jgi:hypothetical protein
MMELPRAPMRRGLEEAQQTLHSRGVGVERHTDQGELSGGLALFA